MTIRREHAMATLSFGTENQTFSNLMGRPAKYKVPPFQRDYSWEEDHWDDFWQDTLSLINETDGDDENSHYMGYLVLQSSDNKIYSIIDGQQRLTTISIMILSGLSYLNALIEAEIDPENNKKRKDEIMKRYIGFVDPITLETHSKLELNRHNNSFYQTYLVTLEKLPQRNLNASEHKIRKAFLWFNEKITTHLLISEGGGIRLAKFITDLLDKLFFTVITVTDELNAFKVFETLNARGVRLSSTDLLKNLIFSTINSEHTHESKFKHLEDKWERIVGSLNGESLPEFLRVYWNSRNKLVRKNDLYKSVKKSVNSKEVAMQLLMDLVYASDIYAAIRDQTDERWSRDEAECIEQLNMFSVRQPLSMLMATYIKFFDKNRNQFSKVLKAVAAISFRYNVICNMKTYEQEKTYSDIAVKIHSDELDDAAKILNALGAIYPEDAVFTSAFAEKIMKTTSARNKKIIKYVLFKIESKKTGKEYDFNSQSYNIEHILPENPSKGWDEFDDNLQEKMVYRIGNMTIMNAKENRNIGNKSYIEKRESYFKSEFQITQSLGERYDIWNPRNILERQKALAREACEIWRVR